MEVEVLVTFLFLFYAVFFFPTRSCSTIHFLLVDFRHFIEELKR